MGTIGTSSTGLPTTTIGTNLGLGNSHFALGGIASGMDTTTIVQELMSIESEPEAKLKLQLSAEQARQSDLQDIQTQLQTLQTDEQALSDPGLWAPSQTVSSSNASEIGATLTGGAAPGGYSIAVTQLATSSQQTFTYTPPASADTITITDTSPGTGGTYPSMQVNVSAGEDINSLAASINQAPNSLAFATVVTNQNGSQSLVLSSRVTGSNSNFSVSTGSEGNITSSSVGTLSLVSGSAVAGVDASYTINGGAAQTSHSNVVANGIPGVQLTLSALTGSNPVTVNVGTPALNQSAIQSALQTFVNQYNTTISDIQGKLSETPVGNPTNATDAGKGALYGDLGLSNLLDQLRQSVGGLVNTGNSSYQLLSQIGISTGAASGSNTPSQNSINGQLTFDTTAFASAMAANPSAVQTLVGGNLSTPGFAQSFDSALNPMVSPTGVIAQWISDDSTNQSDLNTQISNMDAVLQQKQAMLQKQFNAMETAMQQSQSLQASLAGQFSQLAL